MSLYTYSLKVYSYIRKKVSPLKLTEINEVESFLEICKKATGNVYVVSSYGDRYNLKSTLSQYVAIGKLIDENYESLELFCDNKDDEPLFFEFFNNNPETL